MGKVQSIRGTNPRLVSSARLGVILAVFLFFTSMALAANGHASKVLVERDHQGGLLVAGVLENGATSVNEHGVSLAKLNVFGEVDWAASFDATGRLDIADMLFDGAGDLIVTGTFSGSLQFNGHHLKSTGDDDVFIARFSDNGALLWVKSIGGLHRETALRLCLDGEGNIQVQGTASSLVLFDGIAMRARGQNGSFLANFDETGRFTGVWWFRKHVIDADGAFDSETAYLLGLDALSAPSVFESAPEPGGELGDHIQLVGEGGTSTDPDPNTPPPGGGG